MDLVDIDKVLDNLELNEEENKDEKPVNKQLQILHSANLYTVGAGGGGHSPMMGPVASINVAGLDRSNHLSAAPAHATGDRVNRFVGVSQVFSSLDDYRRNVESLEAGIELCTNNGTNDNDTTYDATKNCSRIETVQEHANVANAIRHTIKVEPGGEEDSYAEDDINKFVATDEEHGSSSNSITTSSSSTFSSGPSPALLSSDSEPSFDVRQQIDKSVLLLHSTEHPKPMDNNKLESKSKTNSDCDKVPQRSEFDDLAVGLSSISLTNRGSTTFSSSDMVSSKYILKIENLSSSLSLSQTTKNCNTEELLERQPRESAELSNYQDHEKVEQAGQPTSQQNVMVTFGSTMDEISDTELDSILQEIDAEMPSQTGSDSVNPVVAIEAMKKKTKKGNNVPNQQDGGAMSTGDDAMNIDSFSQASTIEFAEDRTHDDEIDNCRSMGEEMGEEDTEEQKNSNQSIAIAKRQRPTTLDLPVRKINLYASAGQTPPGSRIYDQTSSSSDDDTPENRTGMVTSDDQSKLNDAAGHTPPERSDRSIVGATACSTQDREIGNTTDGAASAIEYDSEMPAVENVTVEAVPENQAMAVQSQSGGDTNPILGKVPPIWVPDGEANACMQCKHKFTLLKRRHHCRACGQVLCSVCCSQKFKLEFLSNTESRVCVQCFLILTKLQQQMEQQPTTAAVATDTSTPSLLRTPNPNNPMEYCSTIPPHRQVNPQTMSYPTVIVPVGVLKKEGTLKKSRKRKSVMFSDGIRPGSDLASLDGKWSDAKHARKTLSAVHFPANSAGCTPNAGTSKNLLKNNLKPIVHDGSDNLIPLGDNSSLPPICITNKSDQMCQDVANNARLIERLKDECLKFKVQTNFYVYVKIVHLECCMNKTVINFTTNGLQHVGNDEIVILLELDKSNEIPKDIFVHLNEIYCDARKGAPITELGFSTPNDLQFLGSREHGGFLFIRPTFQCLQNVNIPTMPFLIGVLIQRWEVPWAKILPLRLMLRLGAQYRYYPCPHISVREREPVYAGIAQTVINVLADFRNYTYTLPTIKGMYIHIEERKTNVLIPRNRHAEVIKAINNSTDHMLAMGGNFSKTAYGHLVCMQNTKSDSADSHSYSTQVINMTGQLRKEFSRISVTGLSFIVFNEALKTTSGLSGKCSIIEDGLTVQILPAKMLEVRNSLINMKDIDIICGPIEAGEDQTEVVNIQWVDNDVEINIGVKSPIDSKEMDGIPSIRVHSGVTLSNSNHIIKWTEVFVIEVTDESLFAHSKEPPDISKISEPIANNTSVALLPFLDLLAANGNVKIGLRVTLNQDNVGYEAGGQNEKLPPLYMNALDNELIPTLHKQATEIGKTIILELIFHILDV